MAYRLTDLRYQRLGGDPERMLANLTADLELKFSVGIWYFTPGGGRFHDRFVPEASVEERLEGDDPFRLRRELMEARGPR